MDHPRDLLHLINLKRKEMPRPIIGIGHSFGGNNLYVPICRNSPKQCYFALNKRIKEAPSHTFSRVNLSLMHPRLITSLILLDPVISRVKAPPPGSPLHIEGGFVPPATIASTHRRDIWPSREAAAESFKKNKFYQAWDPRVLNLFIKHGLRELPTAVHRLENSSTEIPKGEKAVTLTTTRHQEVFTFNRPNFNGDPKLGIPFNRRTHPDLEYVSTGSYPFYRPEVHKTFTLLPHLRPSAMYIFGEESEMSGPKEREEKLKATGTGIGGSGGYPEGRVKPVVLKGVGHLVPMEAVGQTASLSAEWIGAEIKRWRSDEEEFKKERAGKSRIERMTIDDEWRAHAKRPVRSRKPTDTKL